MPRLETLELEIQDRSSNAAAGINQLASALMNLKSAANGVKQLASDMKSVADAVKSVGNSSQAIARAATNIVKVAEALQSLAIAGGDIKDNAAGLAEAASSLERIGNTAESISEGTKTITSLSSALKGISNSSGTLGEAATHIDMISGAVKTWLTDVEGMGEQTSLMSQQATALQTVGDTLARIGNSAEAIGSAQKYVDMLAAAIQDLLRIVGESGDTIQTLSELSDVLRAVGNKSKGVEKAAEALSRLRGASNGGVPSLGEKINAEDPSKGTGDAGKSVQPLIQDFRGANIHVENLTSSLKANKVAVNASALSFKTLGKSIANVTVGKLTAKIKNATANIGKFFASVKRIAMYRGIRTLMKNITQGLSEGIKHLYEWSALVGDRFKGSMDSLTSSAHYLRDSFAAMVSPIIDALAPAVEILVGKFVDLMNVVNQFLATLTGADSWRRAVRQQDNYAENTDKAASAQEKLNHQLMAFDELNNISVNQGGGSGSGKKTDEIDSGHFVTEKLPDWAKDIKDAIENGNWYDAGSLLGQKINGLIDDWDATEWGKKVGEKIQNGIDFYNGLMDTTDWKGLGGKVADWLDAIIASVDGEDLGHAIVAKFNAAIGFLAGFSAEFDWSAAGTWLADVIIGAIKGIDWKNAGELVGNLAGGFLAMIKAGFEELLSNGDKVIEAIADFFSGLGWDGFVSLIEVGGIVLAFKGLFGSVIPSAISGLGSAVSGAFTKLFADKAVSDAIGSGVSSAVTSGISGASGAGFASALSGLGSAFVSFMGTWGLPILGAVGITAGVLAAAKAWDKQNDSDYEEMKSDPAYGNAITDQLRSYISAGEKVLGGDTSYLFDMEGIKDSLAYSTKNEIVLPLVDGVSDVTAAVAEARRWLSKYTGSSLPTSSTPTTSQNTPGARLDPTTNGWFVPEIDTTKQVQALGQITEAAVTAKKKVAALPPADDTVSQFVDKTLEMAGGAKGINTAAVNARKKVTALPPDGDDVSKFTDNALKMAGSLNGSKNSVLASAKDAKTNGISKLSPSKADGNSFWNALSTNITSHLTGDSKSFISQSKYAGKNGISDLNATKAQGNSFWTALSTNVTSHLTGDSKSFKSQATSAGTNGYTALNATKAQGNSFWSAMSTNITSHLTGKKDSVVASAGTANKSIDDLATDRSLTVKVGTSNYDATKKKVQELQAVLDQLNKTYKTTVKMTVDVKMGGTSQQQLVVNNYLGSGLTAYAQGGMPTMGDIFIANEAGPELIGTINGRTAVASNGEITGITDAVYDTGEEEAALLREQNQLLRQLLTKQTNVTLAPNVAAGRWVAQASNAYRKATGG